MKNFHLTPRFVVKLTILFAILFTACHCSEEKSTNEENPMVPDNWLEHSYHGSLTVKSTNTYPEWAVSTRMNVTIDKELGLVEFEKGSLNYSGETLISPSSKIVRSGSWKISPTGRLEKDNDIVYVRVDAGVVVENDAQKLYAKNNSGEWKLVNETNFDSKPNSDLSFVLDEAIINGSVISANSEIASLKWTLRLTPGLD